MSKTNQLIFIDESGDPGLTSGQNSHFIIAAVVIMDSQEADLIRAKMIEFRRSLGWRDEDEFKFSRTRKGVIKDFITLLLPFEFQIQAVVLDKTSNVNSLRISDRYSLYNFVLVELLKQVGFDNASICIDGDVGKKYRKKIIAFIRQNLPKRQKITSFKYADSRKVNELQLADIVAGAIGRSLSNKKDAGDYLKLFRDKIVEIRKI
jgi:hypothetical protein